MSGTFVYTSKGYLNLAKVELARSKANSTGMELISEEGIVLDADNRDFASKIISIVACGAEFECLTAIGGDEEHPDQVGAEPVLAWGLTSLGSLVPITPGYPGGVTEEPYALRKVGSPLVYSADHVTLPDDKAWLAATSADRR